MSIRIHACNAIRYTSVILPGSSVTLILLGYFSLLFRYTFRSDYKVVGSDYFWGPCAYM